jgi:hypothetical protein
MLRRIFGPKREEWRQNGEDGTVRSFIIHKLNQNIII